MAEEQPTAGYVPRTESERLGAAIAEIYIGFCKRLGHEDTFAIPRQDVVASLLQGVAFYRLPKDGSDKPEG